MYYYIAGKELVQWDAGTSVYLIICFISKLFESMGLPLIKYAIFFKDGNSLILKIRLLISNLQRVCVALS